LPSVLVPPLTADNVLVPPLTADRFGHEVVTRWSRGGHEVVTRWSRGQPLHEAREPALAGGSLLEAVSVQEHLGRVVLSAGAYQCYQLL